MDSPLKLPGRTQPGKHFHIRLLNSKTVKDKFVLF